jgi:WD40 repeat protein
MHGNDTLLLFEVMTFMEERPAGDGHGHSAHSVGLAWAFLNVDRALEVSRGGRQRLRLQLHQYKRLEQPPHLAHVRQRRSFLASVLGFGAEAPDQPEAPDTAGRPNVCRELRSLVHSYAETEQRSFRSAFSQVVDWVQGRDTWPAVLEVSLRHVQAGMENVAEALNHELAAVGSKGKDADANAVAALMSPDAANQLGASDAVLAAPNMLAPHNLRKHEQPCDLPDDLLWQIASGERGASRLRISPSGQLLAVAVSRRGGSSELRIFRIGTGEVHAVGHAVHDALVYDLCWHTFRKDAVVKSPSPQLLISCSGDGSVQFFEVPEEASAVDAHGAPLASAMLLLRPHATMHLPSHVYSIALHPSLSADPSQIVLVCGGHGFGLVLCKVTRKRREEGQDLGSWQVVLPHWQEQIHYESQIVDQQTSRPSDVLCVRFSLQLSSPDNLYVSDSAGHVMMFQVRFDVSVASHFGGAGLRASFVRLYSIPELKGIPVYALDVVTPQFMRGKGISQMRLQTVDDWLLLYSKDHMIRIVALQRGVAAGMQVEHEFTGHKSGNFPVRGALSPDGAYLACGSETGELCMWTVSDNKPVSENLMPQVQLAGPVMETIWSEHHHLLVVCAIDDSGPPVLVFLGGDPDKPRPPVDVPPPKQSYAPELAPIRPPPILPLDDVARELRDQFALVPKSIAPPVGHDWAVQWTNTDFNPQSAVSFEEKRRMKENILGQLLDRKGAIELEQRFASMHGVPGAAPLGGIM